MEMGEGDLMMTRNIIPDHFHDDDFMDLTTNKIHPGVFKQYYPSLGLLLKIRRGARHLCETSRRNLGPGKDLHVDTPELLWKLWHLFLWPESFESDQWSPELLFWVSDELKEMSYYLNGRLITTLGQHLLVNTTREQGIIFDPAFLKMVCKYHDTLERPNTLIKGEDDKSVIRDHHISNIFQLANLPRDICPSCECRQHVYCGSCVGVRMRNAEHLLPSRISLPFDVLLLIDWHETLHKCTGVHAAALCTEGTVSVQKWLRSDRPQSKDNDNDIASSGLAKVAANFDYCRDIILFPAQDAIQISELEWPCSLDQGQDIIKKIENLNISKQRLQNNFRLILIESTWNGAKTIVNSLQLARSVLGLPLLRCVALPESIHGLYWKLQHFGSSAVSTIEALTHAATAAGLPVTEANKLLTLFHLQRYRVMKRIEEGDSRAPRAIDVRGPWRSHIVTDEKSEV